MFHYVTYNHQNDIRLEMFFYLITTIIALFEWNHTYFNAGNNGFVLYVTVKNGMYKTLYAHCTEILVADGKRVNAGDIIAKVGNTRKSTEPHLHLEYFVNESRKKSKR